MCRWFLQPSVCDPMNFKCLSHTALSHTTVSHTHTQPFLVTHGTFTHTHNSFTHSSITDTQFFHTICLPPSPIFTPVLSLLEEINMWGYPVLLLFLYVRLVRCAVGWTMQAKRQSPQVPQPKAFLLIWYTWSLLFASEFVDDLASTWHTAGRKRNSCRGSHFFCD